MNQMTFQAHELPSRGYGLPVGSITIKPFGVDELMLLSSSIEEGDQNYLVQAMNNVIDIDVGLLSIGDFFYLMSYQRCACFPNTPISMSWVCRKQVYKDGDGHVYPLDTELSEEKMEQVKIAPCLHHNKVDFSFDDLLFLQVPENTDLPEGFDLPRVALFAEINAYLVKHPEREKLVGCVQWIQKGNTLKERLASLKDEPDLDKIDTAGQLNKTYAHGLIKRLDGKCACCGGPVYQSLDIDASSFFR